MLISKEYLLQQKKMHNGAYGVSGDKYAKLVLETGHSDVLDYGCGKKLLEKALGFKISNYDPAISGLENNKNPHDFVYCGDVLEHIEPEFLDNVLSDISRCMKKEGIFVISTIPAKKKLPDGRNAHLIIKDNVWWKFKLSTYFNVNKEQVNKSEYIAWVSAIG